MLATTLQRALALSLAALALLPGCASSLKYRHGRAAEVVSPAERQQAQLVMTDILDGRDRGAPSDLPIVYKKTKEESLSQLRRAYRAHARKAGLVESESQVASAPQNEAELQQLLERARNEGAKAVLITRLEGIYAEGNLSAAHGIMIISNYFFFVGLAPSIIVFSLPLSGEYASAKVGGYLVDPNTGTVFASYERSFAHVDPKVTVWGFSPTGELKGVLFNTMEQVFEEAARLAGSTDRSGGPQTPIATILFGRT